MVTVKGVGGRVGGGYGTGQTPSTGLRHPSLEEGAGKRCLECEDWLVSVAQRWVGFWDWLVL